MSETETDNFTRIAAMRKAKYTERFQELDSLGRMITVMRLSPSQQLAVQGMCSDLSGTTQGIVDPETGRRVELARDMPLVLAAAVREIDERAYTFPSTRRELNTMVDLLDEEGLLAVSKALFRASQSEKAKVDINPMATAKN